MSLVKSLRRMFHRPAKPRNRSHHRKARHFLEILEDRTLLSVYTVDRLSDTGAGSGLTGDLRYCITHATSGQDTIQFSVNGTINLTGALPDLTRSVSIQGPGADRLMVRRNSGGDYRIFTTVLNTTISISGLTVANGRVTSANGGGILNQGTLTVSNSTVSGNTALGDYCSTGGNGGGILNQGTLTVSNSTLSSNSASCSYGGGHVGGGINNTGTLTVSNSTLSGNSSDSGISNSGNLTITNSTISGNAPLFPAVPLAGFPMTER